MDAHDSILTRQLVPPAFENLTTLEACKDEFAIPAENTGADRTLTRYIAQCSSAISSHCNRTFGIAIWQDEIRSEHHFRLHHHHHGERDRVLRTSHWPLVPQPAAFLGNTHNGREIIDGITSTTALMCGTAIFGAGIPVGAVITAIRMTGITISKRATADATAVPLAAGLQVIHGDLQLTPGQDFEVSAGPGALQRSHGWHGRPIIARYQAGFALPGARHDGFAVPMPPVLEDACLRLLTMRYFARGRDPMLTEKNQPNLGTQKFWVGTPAGQKGAMPPEIAGMLEQFSKPVSA